MKIAGLDAMRTIAKETMKAIGIAGAFMSSVAPFVGIASKDVQKESMAAQDAIAKIILTLDKMKRQEEAKAPLKDSIKPLFDEAKAKIKAAQDALKTTGPPGAGEVVGAPKEPIKPTEPKFASAMEAGSKDAANTILRSQFGQARKQGTRADGQKHGGHLAEQPAARDGRDSAGVRPGPGCRPVSGNLNVVGSEHTVAKRKRKSRGVHCPATNAPRPSFLSCSLLTVHCPLPSHVLHAA